MILKKNTSLKEQSDYTINNFGFDFLEIEEKVFKKGALIEDEKIKILKNFRSDPDFKKRSIPSKMFFYKKPVIEKNKSNVGIDIINIKSSIAEATLLKTVNAILKNEGYTDIIIHLNAIGDKESQKNFKVTLTEFYRKNKKELSPLDVKKITKDPFSIYYSNKESLKELNSEAPSSMSFLSEKSIAHFQEVIEYLEYFGIKYIINESMLGSKLFFSKIIFKIFAKEIGSKEIKEVGHGGRYDEIAEQELRKKKISAIGLSLNFKKKNTKKIKSINKNIKIDLLKIGSTSKLKYLNIIDAFSKINVPIKYNIKDEKISKQIKRAVTNNTDYAIILGETEAKKDKVVIRKMDNFSQKEIKISDLASYIKKIMK